MEYELQKNKSTSNSSHTQGIDEHLTPVLIKKPVSEGIAFQDNPTASAKPITPSSPATPSPSSPINIFISYSHKDEELKDALLTHLANLKRQKKIKAWQDRAIEAGQEWEAQIKSQLESAQVILLLISPDFMASDYCYDIEMEGAIARHDAGTAKVIPVILRPCDWKDSPFSKLQALPKNATPITQWGDRDTAFLDVVKGLRKVIDRIHDIPTAPPTAIKELTMPPNQPENPSGMSQTNTEKSTGFQINVSGGTVHITPPQQH